MITYGIMQGRLTQPKGRGIQFFPFDNWEREFDLCAQIGLNEIEFIFDLEDYENNPLWTDRGIDRIKTLINDTGVSVKSLCFDFFMRRPFYKHTGGDIREVRKENAQILLRMFEAMDAIGGSLIEIPSVDDSSLKSVEEKEHYADFLKEMLSESQSRYSHIRLGLETDLVTEDFVSFIDGIGSDRLGANYDSGNSSGLGYDLYEEVTGLNSRIFNVHIKDRVYKGTTVALGTGSADFERLFEAFKKTGYAQSFIIQAARGEEGRETETIRSQLEFIKSYVSKYELER